MDKRKQTTGGILLLLTLPVGIIAVESFEIRIFSLGGIVILFLSIISIGMGAYLLESSIDE